MADASLSDIVEEVSSEDGVRTVKVEITHKHEERSSATTWAIALGIVLILGIALFTLADSAGGLLSGDDGAYGCNDGLDNDGGGAIDRDDLDCYVGDKYTETNSETNRYNDPEDVPNP